MVLELFGTAIAGYVLGLIASQFAGLVGLVLLALWLLGRAVPPGLLETGAQLVGYVVAPGAELLFVATLLLGIASARTRGDD